MRRQKTKQYDPTQCEYCGKAFTPRVQNGRFCSPKCADLWWQDARKEQRKAQKKETRICEYCGKKFVPKSGNQIYCSKRCGIKKARDEGRRLDKKPAEKEKNVVNKTENMREIARIDRSAREKGLSYGRYIARYGAI